VRPGIEGRREAQRLRTLYWSPPEKKQTPAAGGGRGLEGVAGERSPDEHPMSLNLPRNWSGRLPSVHDRYARTLTELVIANGVGSADHQVSRWAAQVVQ